MKVEVRAAIISLKNNKTPGIDNIPSEFTKYEGEELQKLMVEIWKTEQMPSDWHKSMICPIYMKGDKLKYRNYRCISLLCTPHTVFTNFL
jgi:hypothetical protein